MALAAALLLASLSQARAQVVMELPGQFDVSDQGGASYTIPIAAPPGTAGMVPALALSYGSENPNGLVGIGWSLSGLPSIERCPATMATNSDRGSVDYDTGDRFCLGGQMLRTIGGAYGSDGALYRTELEGFSRIWSRGAAGTGPQYFEVRTKTGQRMFFGSTTDSRLLVNGGTTVRSWALSRVEDTVGNYLTITYGQDASIGAIWPTRIDYTGNVGASLNPYNSIRFTYASRDTDDVIQLYRGGQVSTTNKQLTNIKTYNGETVVHDYRLTYVLSPTTGRTQLASAQLCSTGSTCLPATTFTYSGTAYANGGAMGLTVIDNPGNQNGQVSGFTPITADFNGDGRTDIYWDRVDQYGRSQNARSIWLANGDGTFQISGSVPSSTTNRVAYIGDFNADSKSDILWVPISIYNNPDTGDPERGLSDGNATLWFSDGDGTFTQASGLPSLADGGYLGIMGDFDGDGRTDVIFSYSSNGEPPPEHGTYTSVPVYTDTLWLSNGDGSFRTATRTSSPAPGPSLGGKTPDFKRVGLDLNGDGLSETFNDITLDVPGSKDQPLIKSHTIEIRNNIKINPDSTFSGVKTTISAGVNNFYWKAFYIVNDYNGDGNDDLLWENYDQGKRKRWMATGKKMETLSTSTVTDTSTSVDRFVINTNVNGADGTLFDYNRSFGDYNGDGRTDILWFKDTNDARILWLSKGINGYRSYTNVAGQDGVDPGNAAVIGDFNGDGKSDVLWDQEDDFGRSNGQRKLWLSDTVPTDLLATVTTGLGTVTTVSYKTLSQPGTHYARGTGSTYPTVDVQGPMAVVVSTATSNGIGGIYQVNYGYAAARVNLNGRGFLGFGSVVSTDPQTQVEQTTSYRQDYPYTGTASASTTKITTSSGVVRTLSQVTNTYGATHLQYTQYFVYLQQQVEKSWDLNGAVLPTVTTAYEYDSYGNPTEVVVSTPDGASTTTTNTYTNNTTDWLLGRLTASSVTSTVP